MLLRLATNSGRLFDIGDLDTFDYDIRDIARSLSQKCHFNGHLDRYFSVADHSVLVADIVPPQYKLTALMHDAAEAFTGDIPAPFKQDMYVRLDDGNLISMSDLENRILERLAQKFKFTYPIPDIIKKIDKIVTKTEASLLMRRADTTQWVMPYSPIPNNLIFLQTHPPDDGMNMFLSRFAAFQVGMNYGWEDNDSKMRGMYEKCLEIIKEADVKD